MAESLLDQAQRKAEAGSEHAVTVSGDEKNRKGIGPFLFAAPVAAQAFDAFSTQQALKRSGNREGNSFMEPFADHPAAMYATKIGTGLLAAVLADRLAKDGHPTWAKILSAVDIGVPIAAGVSNLTKGK